MARGAGIAETPGKTPTGRSEIALLGGTRIGPYDLVRPIGRGARGVVYEAFHRVLRRRAALKLLSIPPLGEPEGRRAHARFLREARAAVSVRHPHIVEVFDCGLEAGTGIAFLAMELIEGETLADLLKRQRPLSLEHAVDVILPILSAVAELHAAGIVHRDLKPANILLPLGRDRGPVLADFGASWADDSLSLTAPGILLGTPEYLAPELFSPSSRASERSDQYALGVILYEMVMGAVPFRASAVTPGATPGRAVVLPSTAAPWLPSGFDDVVLRALDADPNARFSSADALAEALAPFASPRAWGRRVREQPTTTGATDKRTGLDADRHPSETVSSVGGTPASQPDAVRGSAVPSAFARLTVPGTASPAFDARGADNARMRTVMKLGVVVWLAYFLLDVLVVTWLGVSTIRFFVALRLFVLAVLTYALYRLRDPLLSARVATTLDLVVITSGIVSVSIMCLPFWGVESPYATGICIILVLRVLFANEPWQRGLVMHGVPALAYPLVMVVGALVEPSIARQFHNPRSLALFVTHLSFVFGMVLFATAGGHIIWLLRRAVVEARELGRYKLKRRIGSGAAGDVWLAHHAALKHDVAIKILRPDGLDDVGISRFEREVRATSELAHPNSVRILDFGITEDGLRYYAMEFLEGDTLAALVARQGPLQAARARHIALQAARALGEAHWRGIDHRDVKPSNLFVTTLGAEADVVKVLDFGIARFTHGAEGDDATLTRNGAILGTPAYMSPEAASGRQVDARADVYALGAVLYFMLTGQPPFGPAHGGGIGVLLAHVAHAPETPSSRLGTPLPQDLEEIVMRCLKKSPLERYTDASALAAALEACGSARAASAPPAALRVDA